MIPFQFIVSEWSVSCERKRCYAIIFTIWLHLFSKNYQLFFKKMMQILNSFHAPNYITLKKKNIFNKICFFSTKMIY